MSIFVILGAIMFGWLLISKPEIIATLFFTLTIADINYEMAGVPLNVRALVGLALFFRTIVSKKAEGQPAFLTNPNTLIIVGFTLYTMIISEFWELTDVQFYKQAFMTLIAVFCGHYYYWKTKDFRYLRISIIISGFICVVDLCFTYSKYGQFPVQRLYQDLLKVPIELDERGDILEIINHNFYGLICGMCFVMLLNEFINNDSAKKSTLLILPVMFLGVLMSTSRSTLLGLIVIFVFLVSREFKHKERAQKAYTLVSLSIGVLFLSLFVFTTLQNYFNLESGFMERIAGRLIDEPVAVFRKHLGLNYNANALDAMDWREEASADAYKAYVNLSPIEQIFGIGFNGYRSRDLGHTQLPPHNGPLLLIIESGLVGLIAYTVLLFNIIRTSVKSNTNIAPLVTTLVFVIFYCIGQNAELTSSITFLFIVYLIAENEKLALEKEPELLQEEESDVVIA